MDELLKARALVSEKIVGHNFHYAYTEERVRSLVGEADRLEKLIRDLIGTKPNASTNEVSAQKESN